jgi:hypothetical protein
MACKAQVAEPSELPNYTAAEKTSIQPIGCIAQKAKIVFVRLNPDQFARPGIGRQRQRTTITPAT